MSEVDAGVQSAKLVLEASGKMFDITKDLTKGVAKLLVALLKHGETAYHSMQYECTYCRSPKYMMNSNEATFMCEIKDEWMEKRFEVDGQEFYESQATVSQRAAINSGQIKLKPSYFDEFCEKNKLEHARLVDLDDTDGVHPLMFFEKDRALVNAFAVQMQQITEAKSITEIEKFEKLAISYEEKAGREPNPKLKQEYIDGAKEYRMVIKELRGNYENVLDKLDKHANFVTDENGNVKKEWIYTAKETNIEELYKEAAPIVKKNPDIVCRDAVQKGLTIKADMPQSDSLLKKHYIPSLAGTSSIFCFKDVTDKAVLVEYSSKKDLEGNDRLLTTTKVIDLNSGEALVTLKGHPSDNIKDIYAQIGHGVDDKTPIIQVKSTAESKAIIEQQREIQNLASKKGDPEQAAFASAKIEKYANIMRDKEVSENKIKDTTTVKCDIDRSVFHPGKDSEHVSVDFGDNLVVQIPKDNLKSISGKDGIARLVAEKGQRFEAMNNGVPMNMDTGALMSKLGAKPISDVSVNTPSVSTSISSGIKR